MSFEVAQARRKQTGRNDVCPCGSGAKYKKCHQNEDDTVIAAELRRRVAVAEAEAKAAAEAAAEEAESKGEARPNEVRPKLHGRATADKKGPRAAGGKAQNLPRRGAV